MAELMAAVRIKSPGRSWLLGRGGVLDVGDATQLVRFVGHIRVKAIAKGSIRPRVLGAILPVGATVSDEFATRLGAWLADVAMNQPGAA